MMADLTGSFRSTSTNRGKRLLNRDPLRLYSSVEFDLVLPIVPRRHRRGALGMAWLDEF
jgi:hypothetical protein